MSWALIRAAFWLLGSLIAFAGCLKRKLNAPSPDSVLTSEVDSASPRLKPIDVEASEKALRRVDVITRVYLAEAVAWANRQSPCSSRCMAFLVAESLAASGTVSQAERKLQEIRRGEPYRRWGIVPQLPGWRGYFGAIEPLVSKGRTTDGRFVLDEGVIRMAMGESIFSNISLKDSPGSFLEVGAVLPYPLPKASPWRPSSLKGPAKDLVIYLGSDKFGHFLSTGYEYLEAYLETYDETLAAGLTPHEAAERAHFGALVRGVLTEATSLGGWTSRVFSYGDLAANYAGFRFFKSIVDHKSPYVTFDAAVGAWKLTDHAFSWADWIDPFWDEGINCSHYYPSVIGDNSLQQQIVGHYLKFKAGSPGQDLSCPIVSPLCSNTMAHYSKNEPSFAIDALVSPICREVAGGKPKHAFSAQDAQQNGAYYDRIGFYSGATITEKAKAWCRDHRDAFIRSRCAKDKGTSDDCLTKIKKVTVERFRCEMDAKDFVGWAF